MNSKTALEDIVGRHAQMQVDGDPHAASLLDDALTDAIRPWTGTSLAGRASRQWRPRIGTSDREARGPQDRHGPANLLAAVQVAASAPARGLGVLVVFNDEIHAARFVSKTHTSKPSAFQSRVVGPIGWLSEGHPVIVSRPVGRFCLNVPSGAPVPPVALIRVALGDDGRILRSLAAQYFRGVVIEGFGGGHVTPPMVAALEGLAREMPVVLASRTGSGELLRNTYRYRGSETELLELGAIPAGMLDGLKARILLSLCLAADPAGENVATAFQAVGMAAAPGTGRAGQPCTHAG